MNLSLSARGRRIVVVDAGEAGDDLIRDMTEVLTSFCARFYGRRGLETGRSRRSVAPRVMPAWQRPGREVSAGVPSGCEHGRGCGVGGGAGGAGPVEPAGVAP